MANLFWNSAAQPLVGPPGLKCKNLRKPPDPRAKLTIKQRVFIDRPGGVSQIPGE
jgi:hypothetical protein